MVPAAGRPTPTSCLPSAFLANQPCAALSWIARSCIELQKFLLTLSARQQSDMQSTLAGPALRLIVHCYCAFNREFQKHEKPEHPIQAFHVPQALQPWSGKRQGGRGGERDARGRGGHARQSGAMSGLVGPCKSLHGASFSEFVDFAISQGGSGGQLSWCAA